MDASAWAGLAGVANFLGNRLQSNYEDERMTRLKKLQEDADMKRQQFLIDYREAAEQRSREADWNRTKDDVMSTFADPETGNVMGRTRSGNSVVLNQTSDAYRTALAQDRELDNAYRQVQIDAVKGRTARLAQPAAGSGHRRGMFDNVTAGVNGVDQAPRVPRGKAPAGYQWTADGTRLEPIPGGPKDPATQTKKPRQLPADMAGRVALAEEYLSLYPSIEKAIQGGDVTGLNAPVAQLGYGKGGEYVRQMKSGRDALQRTLTGAGMPASEAAEYADRYLPQLADTPEKLASKQKQLHNELSRFVNEARGNTPSAGNPQQRSQAAVNAPASAVAALRQNPNLAAQFDAKYGPGAAAAILGN